MFVQVWDGYLGSVSAEVASDAIQKNWRSWNKEEGNSKEMVACRRTGMWPIVRSV
jgi:hypothetical protein